MRASGSSSPPGARRMLARRWQSALDGIPTLLERLVFVAGLKDPDSELYRHFGLELGLGTEQAHAVIAAAHRRVFAQWLSTALGDQKAGVDLMLGRISPNRRHAISIWRRRDLQLQLVPPGVEDHERALFLNDTEVVARILEAQLNGDCLDGTPLVAPPIGSAILGSS